MVYLTPGSRITMQTSLRPMNGESDSLLRCNESVCDPSVVFCPEFSVTFRNSESSNSRSSTWAISASLACSGMSGQFSTRECKRSSSYASDGVPLLDRVLVTGLCALTGFRFRTSYRFISARSVKYLVRSGAVIVPSIQARTATAGNPLCLRRKPFYLPAIFIGHTVKKSIMQTI